MDNQLIFRIVLITLAAFVLFALVNHYHTKQKTIRTEKFYDDAKQGAMAVPASSTPAPAQFTSPAVTQPVLPQFTDNKTGDNSGVRPSEEDSNETYRAVDWSTQQLPNDCFPKDRLTADDLLPHDAADSKWSQVNPAGQGEVGGNNFLTAGYHTGINTVGGSLRNANLQIRSEPPNPQMVVSPWMNTTIQPDLFRSNKNLEILGDNECGGP